jgi:metal-responsive CopG/Arc/MetJ family transcriptional regulator
VLQERTDDHRPTRASRKRIGALASASVALGLLGAGTLVSAAAATSVLAVGAADAAFPKRRPLTTAVPVRLNQKLAKRLEAIERAGAEQGLKGFNKSNLIRVAVETYVDPLIEQIDSEGDFEPGPFGLPEKAGEAPEEPTPLGETVRIRFSNDLVSRLDRVARYSRSIGVPESRSSLIRAALTALLDDDEKADG